MVPEFSVVMLTTQDNPRMIFPFIALSVCNHTGEPSPQISYRHPGWPLSELESDREILRSSSKMESFSEKVQSTQTQTQYLLGLKHGNEPFSPPHPPVLMMSPNKYALINKISHATVSSTLPSTLAIRFSPDKSIPKHRMCLQRFVRTLFASQQLNHFNLKKKKKTQFLEASTLFLSFFSHLGLPFSSKTGSHFPKALICVLKAAITLREDGSTKVSQQDGSLWKWKPSGVHQF